MSMGGSWGYFEGPEGSGMVWEGLAGFWRVLDGSRVYEGSRRALRGSTMF